MEQATVALRELPKAASAAERAAEKWSRTTKDAGRSAEDFSRKVKRTIADLEFERQQLARSTTERARFNALRRAGVAEASAEGQAISASVRALQAQQAALGKTAEATRRSAEASREFAAQWTRIGAIFVGTVGAGAILKAVDSFTQFTNQLKVAGIGGNTLAAVQERLFAMASKNGVAVNALGTLYGRLALSSKELGVDQNRLLEFTEGVTAALRVQGGSTEQASGALLQLSQAMGSGIVRAEEFNSILEGAQPIAQAVANGMEGMGGSIARLRAKILEGTVTSKMFFEAAMKGFEETKRQAQGSSLTIGQSLTGLQNAFINYIGTVDKASGASTALANAIGSISKAMETASQSSNAVGGGRFDKLFDIGAMIRQDVKDIERLMDLFKRLEKVVSEFATNASSYVTDFLDNISVEGARATEMFLEAFRSIPEMVGTFFSNAWESAKVATNKGINALTRLISDNLPTWLGGGRGGTNLNEMPGGAGPVGAGLGDRMAAAGNQAAAEVQAQIEAARQAQFSQQRTARRGTSTMGDVINSNIPNAGAATTTAASGKAAENAAKKYAELTMELELTKTAQDKMTAAAGQGTVAFQEMEAMLAAQQKALDIFGKKLDDNDPRLTKLRDLMLSIAQGKVAESFATATNELKNQNEILEKQIELMGQAPEIIAKEIALIKVRQEAEKGGTAITKEAIEARRAAIEQNETLKLQAEQLKQANELWTAPLKSALESIQSTAADAFEGILESGKLSFDSLKDVFVKTLRRMAAEFLALALIRPTMSVLVNAISPSMAQQMGFGSGNQVTGASAGGGIGSMFGGGGLFSGISDWLGTPLTGPYAGMSPSSMAGVPVLGANSVSGTGITGLGAIGALAGAGMGAYQLLAGGGSTASTIGGIASLVGAGVSLIPGIGQIAGPIIGLLGGLLPGLFGGKPEPPTNRAITSLNFSGGTFNQSGGSYGMDAPELSGLGASMKSLLDAAKVKITSSGFGLQQQTFSKGDFSNATTFITRPDGSQMQWGQSSDPAMQQKALDTAAANVAHSIMLEIGSGISDIMREGLSNFGLQNLQHAFSTQELGDAISKLSTLSDAWANFGRDITDAEAAIRAVDDSFAGLLDTAREFNISTAEIERERDRKRLQATEDFTFGITQSLLEFTDPVKARMNALKKEQDEAVKNNADFLRLVPGYHDQALNIEKLYYERRNEIITQGNAAALQAMTASITSIQSLIRELSPGGALSGLDPRGQLAGLRASASSSLAQAMADPTNVDLINRAVADQRAFIEFNKSFTGGGVDYQSDVKNRIGLLQNLQGGVAQAAMNQTSDPITHSYLAQILAAVQRDRTSVENVMALLARYLANPEEAA